MSSARVVLLAVTIEGPELPLPTHLDRPISVCFCGRPLPIARLTCDVCGWRSPQERRRIMRMSEGDAVPWWQRRMVAFDVETTGTDPEHARIVQAAVALVGGGEETRSWSMLVDPGVEIPPETTKVHGITTEMVREHGRQPVDVLVAIVEALTIARDAGCVVVAFNARFDLTVLDRELLRRGLPGRELLRDLLVVDPFVLDKHLVRYRSGKRGLLELCTAYDVLLEGEHDATFDAIAAARLAYRMGQRGKVVRRTRDDAERQEFISLVAEWEAVRNDAVALYGYQRELAYEDAVQLEEYFRKGNPGKGVPAQPERDVPKWWPIIPG